MSVGLHCAPGAVTVMAPVCVPAGRVVFTVTGTDDGALPEAVVKVSHD